ncbi:hypothetical protein LCGC14_1946180 [marine sediment metagenome]|uniref:Uncharacterized protein n=1 Tax=marine sediment metagenome TaxID=412755 RepID=A0A0F9FIU6_9ZZZZ
MITFKVVKSGDERIVLILRDDKLIAVIRRYEEGKIRLVSQYYDGIINDSGPPLAVIIKFAQKQA